MAYHGKTRGTVAREKFDIIAENLYMDKWGNFVFNEPYIGNEIKQINNVVLPKQYLEFMKKHNGGQGDIGETWLEPVSYTHLDPAEKEDAVAAVHTGGWNGDQGIPAGGLPGNGGAFLRYGT